MDAESNSMQKQRSNFVPSSHIRDGVVILLRAVLFCSPSAMKTILTRVNKAIAPVSLSLLCLRFRIDLQKCGGRACRLKVDTRKK